MSVKVTYIGHATLLIEWDQFKILTDPVFSQRILCFKRRIPLSFPPQDLPKLDAVLLTHAHYDHLDLFSYKYIAEATPIFIPEGMKQAIIPFTNNPIVELATWGRFSIRGELEICAVPAKHPGGRLILPFRYRKCHSYVLTLNQKSIFLCTDTAYHEGFENLHSLFSIKLALLPCALPRSHFLYEKRHMSLNQVKQAWEDLGKPDWIPTHWGSFFKSYRSSLLVPSRLEKLGKKNPEFREKLHIVPHGESVDFNF